MHSLPVFLRLEGTPVILIGTGDTADAKRRLLERAGARVIEESGNAALAIVALEGDSEAESAIARLKARGILVNAVDRPALCDFTIPAIIDRDPVLIAIYPEDEWAAAANRLLMFLEQYWGGPHTYSELRGHPRLRARHAVFVIDRKAHDHWLTHMRSALDDVGLAPEADQVIWSYLQTAADMLINTP